MIVKLFVNSKASIHSTKEVTFDLDTEKGQKRLGYTKEEWKLLDEEDKDKIAYEWALENIEWGFEEEQPEQSQSEGNK